MSERSFLHLNKIKRPEAFSQSINLLHHQNSYVSRQFFSSQIELVARHSNSNMDVCNLSTLEDCTATGNTYHKTSASKCNLTNVEFRHCKISDSTLYNCRLYDCVANDCSISDSVIYGGRALKCSIKKTEFKALPPTLRKLPVEVRHMIFELCLKWEGFTPSLLAGLRGNRELHEEAIAIFRNTNVFKTSYETRDRLTSMSETARRMIKRVEM